MPHLKSTIKAPNSKQGLKQDLEKDIQKEMGINQNNSPEKKTLKRPLKYKINIDNSRDNLLSDFGKAVLKDRYLLEDESFQDLFARVASYYGDNQDHAQRLYEYISKLWMMPATPVLSNGGTKRGLPISCFLNEVDDNLHSIVDKWNENVWLASNGGGIGTYWGNVRSIGEKVRGSGRTSGIIPFIGVQDRLTLAISQGNLRRGSAAVYLPVWHPEIEEFIEIRKPTGGDPNRKSLNLHHGVVVTDAFMKAVEEDAPWELVSPKNKDRIHIVKARDIWIRILTTRLETGEPYILFIDAVNKGAPEVYKRHGFEVVTSNLCTEITLKTGKDQHNKTRTAVCCLSSLNLEYYEEWEKNPQFIDDIMRFLDNVLSDFIKYAPKDQAEAAYSASMERSVGLGVMGFHSFLQSKNIPLESVMAKVWNKDIFTHIKENVDKTSIALAEERGACPDAEEVGLKVRFSHSTSVAPTASISIIANNASPGIEPYTANTYTQKTLTGSFNVRNKHLKKLLKEKNIDNDDVWSSIMNHGGSIQQLTFLTQHEKDVFKTAFEMDQRWIIDLAADRTPYVDQAQSLNIFIPANIHKRDLHQIHFMAWKKGIKSLYYARSKSLQRADTVSINIPEEQRAVQLEISLTPKEEENKAVVFNNDNNKDTKKDNNNENNYDECLACQ